MASMNTRDPDSILGIRRDFRREKVYTIDSASTVEIDDGLSLEVISNHRWKYTATILDSHCRCG